MTLPPPPESSPVSTSSRGPRLGGSIFPASREAPIELGRYAVVSMLGKGGMGVVYEAVDRERGQVVALKTLRSLDPNGLRRLKAEFRSVADIVHRNLVLLHELVSDGDDTFFVMDYVAGENFLDHVRGKRMSPREKSRSEPLAATLPEPVVRTERTDDDDVAPPLDPTRFDRLGETMIQVVCGRSALHKAGKFHRDVKPTNVRVTAQGRAVVLDFGLVKGDGVSNTTIDFVGFCLFYYVLGLDLVVSNILSFIPAVTNSYLLKKYWSFGHVNSGRRSAGEYSVFILIALCGLGINTFVLWAAEEHMLFRPRLPRPASACSGTLLATVSCFFEKKSPEQI